MKLANDIKKWGFVKPYFDKEYQFNSIDIETINNEMFIFGFIHKGIYHHFESDFYNIFHKLLLNSIRNKCDILTWTRYDNTYILKMLLQDVPKNKINNILKRINKVTPIYTYIYDNYTITIVNIIKDSMIFQVQDGLNKKRQCVIYNLKNLFNDDLSKVAHDYGFNYYSKLGEEFHIIDKNRFYNDDNYHNNVLLSNKLDNQVIIDIANKILVDFKSLTGVIPKSIYTAGSIARSYLLSYKDLNVKDLQFKTMFAKNELFDELLDYSMRSYHGGKIESYVLGYIPTAKIIDITSAYPFQLSKLPKLTNIVIHKKGDEDIDKYFYAFIHCDIIINNEELIHPVIVSNPINHNNISPVGIIEDVVITKIEYDYLLNKKCDINVPPPAPARGGPWAWCAMCSPISPLICPCMSPHWMRRPMTGR